MTGTWSEAPAPALVTVDRRPDRPHDRSALGALRLHRPAPGLGGKCTGRGAIGLGGIRTRRGGRDAEDPSG